MGLTLVQLANDALTTLGEQPIVNLNPENATSTAILINQKWPLIQRTILMEADWNCARRTAKLARLDKPETHGYKYVFQLPKDPECLQVQQISLDGGVTYIDLNNYYNRNAGPKAALFDIDGDTLLANVSPVFIKYTALIDVSYFDPFLAAAFSMQLAAELAYAIPASVTLAQHLEQMAKKKLYKAISRNALNRNIIKPEGEVIGIRGFGERYVRVDMSDQEGQ